MAYLDPEFGSWDLVSSQYYQDNNGYGVHSNSGFVYPLDDLPNYSFSDRLAAGVVYPMDKTVYNPPSSSDSLPTDVFQSVASTNYNTPASFEYPLFEGTQQAASTISKTPSPIQDLPLHDYQIPNQTGAITPTSLGPPLSGSPPSYPANYNVSSSSTTIVDTKSELISVPQSRKRRQPSDSSECDNLARARRTRIVKSPKATAKVRVIGACLYCKKRRTTCREGHDPEGACMPCLELAQKITVHSGLLRPMCWRPPKLKNAELFRRGPTIDFAVSLRGHKANAKPGKQAVWDLFATGTKGKQPPKVVQLSQHWTSNSLTIELQRYLPMETDKQHYTWYEEGIERHYDTPPYGITNWRKVHSSIERFMEQNFEQYINAHMRDATEITSRTFKMSLQHRHLPLVDRALKIWVGCRFIEEPWSITSEETLNLYHDPNPSSPYHTRIPVPPIVDLQIDLIVINAILQPLLKETLTMMNELLESSGPWKDWFEIYLAYFVLLHNVELTMMHDAWFVRRHNLQTKYSNRPLVETIMSGATTLLSCFHYAHQGYVPFTNPELEKTQSDWTEEQKEYLRIMRRLFKGLGGDHVGDPGKELFWTSQLVGEGWRPVFVS